VLEPRSRAVRVPVLSTPVSLPAGWYRPSAGTVAAGGGRRNAQRR
jgi:hypothetical protein